jgi:methylaspartate ammonia-lyase
MSAELDAIEHRGRKLHPSVCYGASQAILDAVARSRGLTPAEVIAAEYKLDVAWSPVRIHTQSGDDRYTNVDKMILKEAGFMPHGLINNAAELIGNDGAKLVRYAHWVCERIRAIGAPGYRPALRFDVYGTLGEALGDDPALIVTVLAQVRAVTEPFDLFVEMPVDMGDETEQFRVMREIRRRLKAANLRVNLIIDEYANTLDEIKRWANSDACDMVQVKTPDLGALHNTVEAVLYCHRAGKLAYLGGSCAETDQSARLCTNIALATQPFACAAKPGMGVDEGIMIVRNEMQRTLAVINARRALK